MATFGVQLMRVGFGLLNTDLLHSADNGKLLHYIRVDESWQPPSPPPLPPSLVDTTSSFHRPSTRATSDSRTGLNN